MKLSPISFWVIVRPNVLMLLIDYFQAANKRVFSACSERKKKKKSNFGSQSTLIQVK